MKNLPVKTTKEIRLDVDYVICRFMKNKKAYKTTQNPKLWFTIKGVQEVNLPPQVQLHLRFSGRDEWNEEDDVVDLDLYVNRELFESEIRNMINA